MTLIFWGLILELCQIALLFVGFAIGAAVAIGLLFMFFMFVADKIEDLFDGDMK